MGLKKRTPGSRKEDEALSALQSYCAAHDLILQAKPQRDYGVDCYVEVAVDDAPRNFLVGVQSKAGSSYRRKAANPCDFKISLRANDIQYWLAANYPIVLVYYDDVLKEQYFKHIQDEWERSDRKACQYVVMRESDRVTGANLANYLRSLVAATPSTSSRLEVIAKPLTIEVNEVNCDLAPVKAKKIGPLSRYFQGCEENRVEHSDRAFLLGYSADENWCLESRFESCGMTGFTMASAFLHHLGDLRTVQFEILKWADFEASERKGNPFPADEVTARLREAASAVEQVGLFEPQVLYRAPERISVDTFDGPPIHLLFGTERFEICIETDAGRQFVLLKNNRYRPSRIATLFAERIQPVFHPGLEIEILIRPTPMVGITEIAASASGKRIAFTVATNAEHNCWGHPREYVLHLETDRIRDACRTSLL